MTVNAIKVTIDAATRNMIEDAVFTEYAKLAAEF